MENTKLYIKELNKSFSIRHTNKLIRYSYQFQLEMAKMGQIGQEESEPEKQFEFVTNYSQTLLDFPRKALKLTDKQVDKLDDMDQEDLQKLDVKLALTIQGMNKQDIQSTLRSMDDAQKSTSEENNAEWAS